MGGTMSVNRDWLEAVKASPAGVLQETLHREEETARSLEQQMQFHRGRAIAIGEELQKRAAPATLDADCQLSLAHLVQLINALPDAEARTAWRFRVICQMACQ